MRLFHSSIFALVVSLTPGVASSQASPQWTFSGRLIDARSGGAVSAAAVSIPSMDRGVLSRSDGGFSVTVPGTDSVVVQITQIGRCLWQRLIGPPGPSDSPVIELYPESLQFDGNPSFSVPGWRRGLPLPLSPWLVKCQLERLVARSGRVLRLNEPLPWQVPLQDVAELVLEHQEVVTIGNRVRGDQPLLVGINDPSLAGVTVIDAPLPHRFLTGESALTSLAQGAVPAIAVLALRNITSDTVTVMVYFEDDYQTWADRLPQVPVTVTRVGDQWRLLQP